MLEMQESIPSARVRDIHAEVGEASVSDALYIIKVSPDENTLEKLQKEEAELKAKVAVITQKRRENGGAGYFSYPQDIRRIIRRIEHYYMKQFVAINKRLFQIRKEINYAQQSECIRLEVGMQFWNEHFKHLEYLGRNEKGEHLFREVKQG